MLPAYPLVRYSGGAMNTWLENEDMRDITWNYHNRKPRVGRMPRFRTPEVWHELKGIIITDFDFEV